MEVGSWCNSSSRHWGWSRSFSETESESFVPVNFPVTGSKVPIWRVLWRKAKKEKKKIFDYSYSSRVHRCTYDPCSYAQNFDKGSMWDDCDDLSRSFSARFAAPSRIFQKSNGGLIEIK